MTGDDDPSQAPPSFAMTRAVEILANIYEKQRRNADVLPPPLDRVVQIFNEAVTLDVTRTTRADVERALGIGFAYPVRGWHTYCVRGGENTREFLSLFYSQNALLSAELYVPKVQRAPALAPRNLGRFRLIPGEITIGMQFASLPERFATIPAPTGFGPYDQILEARFPGGSVYVMGCKGTIERLAIYGRQDSAPAE
ncbi:MAG TPA: hypothetical protein VNG31_06760 [Candidatus Baltobacteraceae bacterium]|nr:hypothetical protein [Candidatus Baltobacteraceae bacterium]